MGERLDQVYIYPDPQSLTNRVYQQFHWCSICGSRPLTLTLESPFCPAALETALLTADPLLPLRHLLPADRNEARCCSEDVVSLPHSMSRSNGGTGWDLIQQGLSLLTGSSPQTTTSLTAHNWRRICGVLPQVQWGRIPLPYPCLATRSWKHPVGWNVAFPLSSFLRKVCVLLTLPPSSPNHTPVSIEALVTTKSGFCRPAHDIHIFNGNKLIFFQFFEWKLLGKVNIVFRQFYKYLVL